MESKQKSKYTQLGETQREEIRKAFDYFDVDGSGTINAYEALKVTFTALGFQPTREELKRIIADHEREINAAMALSPAPPAESNVLGEDTSSKMLDFNTFLEIVTKKMDEPAPRKEIKKAFRLFGGNKETPIGISHLQDIADSLGVRMTQEQLEEMLLQALPKSIKDECARGRRPVADQLVSRDDFLSLMQRTGQYFDPPSELRRVLPPVHPPQSPAN
ncbi:putative Ca2+-binding protein/EF-hand superfamily protein [Paratrimastix pyriformis]|uniref:Ca2+-binding protein/EF-hand superfamily protein n=1 Tax=Paratrimastix pyriformis TaxID=342808 RepID=A0ABQ8U5H5_9EUKA|nr:putative Ca2+-binding protein/EF-hand superfamily protein [Paratrimastix pyriformis]